MDATKNILALLNPGTPSGGSVFFDSLAGPVLIVGVALVLGLIILIIVLAMHRDGGGSQKSSRSHRLTKSAPRAPGEEGRTKKRKRHKRRRRDHRKRNPTLSETGGLPPRNPKDNADNSSAPGES